ncbi:MAG: hypothetical protein QXU18_03445 [Thermoplasmatales archaeon]
MVYKVDYRDEQLLFTNRELRDSFRALYCPIKQTETMEEKGPLRIILENKEYFLSPAKGGSSDPLKKWPDVTYFTHILNAMVIGGKIFEAKFLTQRVKNNANPTELKKYTRLFFAAAILHDSDKLFHEGMDGANNLEVVLEKNKQEIIKLCAFYLQDLGAPLQWWNDLKFLILRTENRTMDLANSISTHLNRTELATISQLLKLGDQAAGIKSVNTIQIFSEIKKLVDSHLKSIGTEIHIIKFENLPQLLMLNILISAFFDFLKREGIGKRNILSLFPDAILFMGPPLSESDYDNIFSIFRSKMSESNENIDNIIENFAPSGNSIKLNFSNVIESTPDIVRRYVEKFNGRLLIWQGESWKNLNKEFDINSKLIGVPIVKVKKNGKDKFNLDLPEHSEEIFDEDTQKKRMMGLIACAERVLYSCQPKTEIDYSKEDDLAIRTFGENVFHEADALQKMTIEAISHAGLFKDSPLESLSNEYDAICRSISSILTKNYDAKSQIDYRKFFDRALGLGVLIEDPPDKASMCIYCGIFADIPLKEENSFGIKPTGGTGRKITVLKYDELKFNGKICKYCMQENMIRRSEIGKENEALCMHVYLGDYYVPVNLENVISVLKSTILKSNEMRFEDGGSSNTIKNTIFRVGKRSRKELESHMVLFIPKPKKKVEEFYRLYNILRFISDTGTKIRLSSLISAKRIFLPMFEWDNAPSWAKNLKMDWVRIDKLDSAIKELDLIYWAARISKSQNAISWVIHAVNMGRRGIFQVIYRNILGDSAPVLLDKYPKLKEGVMWYMEKYRDEINKRGMDRIVDEACGVIIRGPKSNNDNTWIFREALRVYLRYYKNDREDLKSKISGWIWVYANRQEYSGKKVQEHCVGFSDGFVDLMKSDFKDRIPRNDERKVLIAQFALMFNMEKWNRIKSKKEENEKDE